jgi:Holliday junction resolvasome RuvABC DNA-binding subunit
LGYNNKKADLAITAVLNKTPDLTLEELIKNALAGLNK